MRAAPGAVERVQVIQGGLMVQTIDNFLRLVLRFGILDAVACMLQIGLIDHRGSLATLTLEPPEWTETRVYPG